MVLVPVVVGTEAADGGILIERDTSDADITVFIYRMDLAGSFCGRGKFSLLCTLVCFLNDEDEIANLVRMASPGHVLLSFVGKHLIASLFLEKCPVDP